MDGAFTVWSGLFYFLLGASFSIFTCTYIVLGAGLNRGWRDSLFVAFCFCFCFFLCSRWDGRKPDGGFLTRRDETNCACSLVRSGVTTTTYRWRKSFSAQKATSDIYNIIFISSIHGMSR